MTKAILVLHGRTADDEQPSEPVVVAEIFAAEQSEYGDYFCRVSLPTLFGDDRRIFGVDAEQAEELSLTFAHDLLNGFGIKVTDARERGDR